MIRSITFNRISGEGPFTIQIREVNEPTSVNRVVGENPRSALGTIEFNSIADGLQHQYILRITSPNCEPYETRFSILSSCTGTPTVTVEQDCINFTNGSTTTVGLKVTSTLSGSSNVLVKIFEGTSTTPLFSELVGSTTRTFQVQNSRRYRIRSENSLYPTCFTEVVFDTLCTQSPNCTFTLEIGAVTPGNIVSKTPVPTITSAVLNTGTLTITGTSVCNGLVRLYKRNTNNVFIPITERTIVVNSNVWSYSFSGEMGVYAADAYCTNFTTVSDISSGFQSILEEEEPPEETYSITRSGIDFIPNNRMFVFAQSDGIVEMRLTSTNHSTNWLTMETFGSNSGGLSYNRRSYLSNFPNGTYTIQFRIKDTTDVISIQNVVLNTTTVRNIYDENTVVNPESPEQTSTFRVSSWIIE